MHTNSMERTSVRAKHRLPNLVPLLFLFLNLSASMFAQPDIRFQHLTIENGLSQSSVNCILQDRRGLIWLGTEAGLNEYDGCHITLYEPNEGDPTSLGNNFIYTLLEDRFGQIWVGTEKGLDRLDPATRRFVHYLWKPDDLHSLSSNRVFKIFEDHLGMLWIGTDNGLNRFDRERGQFVRYQSKSNDPSSLSNNDVRCICEDRTGSLWVGTYGGGLNRLDWSSQKFSHYQDVPGDLQSLSDDYVLAVCEDHLGVLWAGTRGGGLNRFIPANGFFQHFKNNPKDSTSLGDDWVNCIDEDEGGILWVGTNEGGLSRLNRETWTFTNYRHIPGDPWSLNDNRILSIASDHTGILWIGTYDGGLNEWAPASSHFVLCSPNPGGPEGLSNARVRSFFKERSGVLWVGTDGGGIDVFDQRNKRIRHYANDPEDPSSLGGNRVFSIKEDLSGIFWIGTYGGGLSRFDPNRRAFINYRHKSGDPSSLSDDRIRTLHFSQSGVLWIGTDGGGLNRFEPRTGRFTCFRNDPTDPNSLSNNRVWAIAEEPSGVLWIGTYGGGVYHFDPAGREFIHYRFDPRNANSLSNDYIVSLCFSPEGILWIGSDGGLCEFDTKKIVFKKYTTDSGLPSNIIYGILQDRRGSVWLSSEKGLSHFDPQAKKFTNYEPSDGIQSYEFNGGACAEGPDGSMYFGGINGFNVFHPENIKDNLHKPPVLITDFQLFNKRVPIGRGADGRTLLAKDISETNSLKLSYGDRSISFEFSALDYTAPEKNQYAYKIVGFDRDWIYSGNRHFATYTNLPPGKYVFRVRGSNNDGVWNEQGASLSIRIIPPFWRTLPFYLLVITVLIATSLSVFNLRTRWLRRSKWELENLVQKRTQELEEVNGQLNEANRKLELLAITDGLTGIANYRRFREALSLEWRRALRYKYPLSIIILDVDDFKAYNDTYGHQAGDDCLIKVARVLVRNCRRPGDLSARYGGDEFIVVLSHTNRAGALRDAERIRADVEVLGIRHDKSRAAGSVTVSLGCTTAFASTGMHAGQFVEVADQALYDSKRSGRNRVTFLELSSLSHRNGQSDIDSGRSRFD